MPRITTFLAYDDQAEEAAKFYVSVLKSSRIRSVTRYGEAGPGPPKGSVMTVAFELDGQALEALLNIGEPKYHERLVVLRREIKSLTSEGTLGKHKYSTTKKDFVAT